MKEFLRNIPLFADLPEGDLTRLCEMVEEVSLSAGETLFTEGSAGDRAYIIKEGQLEIVKSSIEGREVLLSIRESGEVIGEVALLEDRPRMASVRARRDTILLAIPKEALDFLLRNSASAASTLFYNVLRRWRSTESLLRQSEKMAQLGTLTAGVAHELNNPAAAVRRGVDQLQTAVTDFVDAHFQLNQLDLSDEQGLILDRLSEYAQVQATRPLLIDALTRSDREYELETWLESNGISNGWELAPVLVNFDLPNEELTELTEKFSKDILAVVVGWLGHIYTGYNLLAEIGQGAERISSIVRALKSYTFLDRAPIQDVDIQEGLDNTLLILRHKLKGINVHRQYADNLPEIEGYGSELNQVWTNLIDNAADALGGSGDITIRTRREEGWAVIEIEDNGPGIPQEVQTRMFEPFFTTKEPGLGTGLGLDISYNIVVHKHRGDIKVVSSPGQTCFEIRLPIHDENK